MEKKPGAHRRPHDLTGGPIARTLLLFALPVLGSNVLQSLNGSINAVWVGRFLGEDIEHRFVTPQKKGLFSRLLRRSA